MFGKKPKATATIIILESPWPDFHSVDISQSEVWRFLCFYTVRLGESVIERNLIPKPAMGYALRFQFFFELYDYDRAYAELPSSGLPKSEKIMVELNNDEIYVLLRARYRELGDQLDRYNGNCKPTLARMTELAELVKPPAPGGRE